MALFLARHTLSGTGAGGHGRGPAPDVSEVDLTLPALGEREFSRLLDLGLACLDLSYVEMREFVVWGRPPGGRKTGGGVGEELVGAGGPCLSRDVFVAIVSRNVLSCLLNVPAAGPWAYKCFRSLASRPVSGPDYPPLAVFCMDCGYCLNFGKQTGVGGRLNSFRPTLQFYPRRAVCSICQQRQAPEDARDEPHLFSSCLEVELPPGERCAGCRLYQTRYGTPAAQAHPPGEAGGGFSRQSPAS
ncbi:uncharacterized protein BFRF2 [human gammaherpesvirus 4]|uniref:Uncharacterized protein BFRF2 n=1 Tax=Epstein-Barr virus (strain GD1) TaxID=10376 RepID=A0A0B6VKY8_EBVG|nr:uncharacterized protein BFRF2 [human gammaherpesvirus 4]